MGFFYALGDWRALHGKLKEVLDAAFDNCFSNNGNSFDTCFQFVSLNPRGRLYLRIKVYNKLLAFFQSDGVMKSMGMNTKAIYYPGVRMSRALTDSREAGLTRIEITYQAFTPEAERQLWSPFFLHSAYNDLDKV